MNVIEKLFGTHSERELKMIRPILAKIENLRPEMIAKSDEELRDQTRILKAKLADGATLDDILPEAFATVREAAKRVLGMEHFEVQLIGGIVLHQGRIAEMKTGEGKTLVSTSPAYLNALEAYIKVKVFTVKFDTNNISAGVLSNAQTDYAWAAHLLQSEMTTPSVSEMESITRYLNTLIKPVTHFDNGFKNLGDREYRRRY